MERQQRIQWLVVIVLGGFVFAVLFHYAWGIYAGWPYPYNTFLFDPSASFKDFFYPYVIADNPYTLVREIDPAVVLANRPAVIDGVVWDYARRGPLYFPFAYWVAGVFRLFPAALALLVFWLLGLGLLAFANRAQLGGVTRPELYRNLLVFTLLPYPVLFALDRSNFEIILFIFLYGFAVLYPRRPRWSLVFLGAAIAMKVVPAVFALILLADRRYRQLVLTAAGVLVVTLAGYALYPGGLIENIRIHAINLLLISRFYSDSSMGLYFGHSLMAALKYLALTFDPSLSLEAFVGRISLPYNLVSLALLAGVGAYVVWIEKVYWKRIALLVCLMNLLPAVSGDYKLLHLLVPLYLFVNHGPAQRSDRLYVGLFGLLLIPKAYTHLEVFPQANSGVLLNPLLMLVLIAAIVGEGLVAFDWRAAWAQMRSKRWLLWGAGAVVLVVLVLGWGVMRWRPAEADASLVDGVVAELEQRGRQAEALKDWHEAGGYYDQWKRLRPEAATPRLRLAETYSQQGKYSLALWEYRQVSGLPSLSEDEKTQSRQGVLQVMTLWGHDWLVQGQYARAAASYQELLAQYPDAPAGLKGASEAALLGGSPGPALEWFERWHAAAPAEAEEYLQGLDWRTAEVQMREWMQVDVRREADGLPLLGWAALQTGDLLEAEARFRQTLALRPTGWAYHGLAATYYRLGDCAGVNATLEDWRSLSAADPNIEAYGGLCAYRRGQWQQAAVELQSAVDQGVHSQVVLWALADALVQSGQPAQSEALPQSALALARLAEVYQQQGDCRRAVLNAQRALALDVKEASASRVLQTCRP